MAGRCLYSPEEEEESDVAAEKLGLSLRDGTTTEAIFLVSGYDRSQAESFKIHPHVLDHFMYLHKRPISFDSSNIKYKTL